MGNPISSELKTGTLGELFVQLKLLEYGIQAAPPLKDSGNDLVAVKGEFIKLIQVKTSINKKPSKGKLPEIYHLLALVELVFKDNKINYDKSKIWIIKNNTNEEKELSQHLVNEMFS